MEISTNSNTLGFNFAPAATKENSVDTEKKNADRTSKNEQKEEKDSKESTTPTKFTPDEERMIRDLQARDTEVRAHEAAHKSGGASTGAATFTYQQGPDGRMYAIGGEVSVSMKGGSTPEETIANAQAVIAAAMAPASPSPQDYAVASSAKVIMSKAQQQKAKELQEELLGKETYKKESDKNPDDITNKKEDDSIKGSSGLDIPA